jgi:3-oxoadipate enol-lactonase
VSGQAGFPKVLSAQVDDFHEPWRDAIPVVLLHGFARNREFWRGWVPQLSRDRAVVRPDMRGCGASAHLAPTYDTDILIDDVLALMDSLEVERFHVVGESSGGLVAAYAALHHPERVASATLVSTPMLPAAHDKAVKSAGYDSTEEALQQLGLDGWWMESRRIGGELTGDGDRDHYYARQLARTPLASALAMWEWIHDPDIDLLAIADQITPPVLVLSPGTSHGTNTDQQERFVAALPRGRQHVFTHLNHEMYYLRAAEVAEVCAEFLAAQDSAAVPAGHDR